jgi:predicted ATPase
MLRGWAMTELGQTERGVAELEAAAASSPVLPTMMLAQVYARDARADRALAIVDEQLARAERTGGHLGEQELHRLKGEAILRRDPSAAAQAEACFRRAIEIARGQSVKWAELRSTVSLARLLRSTNRRDEARAMLAEIYNWFSEGFDTADLKDARVLLEELSTSP